MSIAPIPLLLLIVAVEFHLGIKRGQSRHNISGGLRVLGQDGSVGITVSIALVVAGILLHSSSSMQLANWNSLRHETRIITAAGEDNRGDGNLILLL